MKFGLSSLLPSFRSLDDCRIDAELHLSEGSYCLPGMIMKIGDGVVLFREASAFILERNGMPAHLIFEGGDIKGHIIRSTRDGYLIRADAPSLQAA